MIKGLLGDVGCYPLLRSRCTSSVPIWRRCSSVLTGGFPDGERRAVLCVYGVLPLRVWDVLWSMRGLVLCSVLPSAAVTTRGSG